MAGDHDVMVDHILFDSWREDDYEMAATSVLVQDARIAILLRKDWTILTNSMEIYQEDCDSCERLDEDQLKEVVRKKYYYAGGCARFMFEMNVERLKSKLEDQLQQNYRSHCVHEIDLGRPSF